MYILAVVFFIYLLNYLTTTYGWGYGWFIDGTIVVCWMGSFISTFLSLIKWADG